MPGKGVASRSSYKNAPSLSKLIEKNIHYSEFDNKIQVRNSHLQELVSLGANISLSTKASFSTHLNTLDAAIILDHIKESNANWVNFNSLESLPKAFIIIGKDEKLWAPDYFEMGILVQSILLRATEMGLNGSYSILEDGTAVAHKLSLDFIPAALIAIGKGKDL